jgi:hypothetical protein
MRGAIPPLPHMPSWRGAHSKQRGNFNFPFTFTFTYQRLRSDAHLDCMRETRNEMHTEFSWAKLLKTGHFEDREGDGKITLKWISGERIVRMRSEWKRLGNVRLHY